MIVFGEESSLGPLVARVYKSGDLSQPSSIDVETFMLSGKSIYVTTVLITDCHS